MAAIRILLVDDHSIVRQGIRCLLEQEDDLEVVGEAAGGRAALEWLEAAEPDLVLLDVRLPDMDGAEVCRQIQARRPWLPVIILSAYADEESVLACIHAGARGYVLKDADVAELVRTIRAALRGESVLHPQVVGIVLDELRRATEKAASGLEFSQREQEIIRLVSQGLTNKEIGGRLFLSASTIKVLLSRIMERLGVSSRAAVAYEASRRGLVRPGGPGSRRSLSR